MTWGTAWDKPIKEFVEERKAEFEKHGFDGLYLNKPEYPVIVGIDWAKPGSDITTLTIPMKDAWPRTVKARIIGDLAIHEHLDYPDSLQVTHVPTCTFFLVPEGATEEQLVIWCKKVQKNLIEDWAELRQLTNLTYTDESANDCKSRIKEMCEGITPKDI